MTVEATRPILWPPAGRWKAFRSTRDFQNHSGERPRCWPMRELGGWLGVQMALWFPRLASGVKRGRGGPNHVAIISTSETTGPETRAGVLEQNSSFKNYRVNSIPYKGCVV